MNRRQRNRTAAAGLLATMVWLVAGTIWFVHWQASEEAGGPSWAEAIEAALLVALVFWVLAGIAYGIIVWIVTGRGPQA